MQRELGELKVVVSNEVFTTRAGDFSQQLKLIDAIQRLGMANHFEREIREALEGIHNAAYNDDGINDDGDLYNVALRFRLLRQHGFNVSCGLYEATHLRVHGEDILEEAHVFTTTHLKSTATSVNYSMEAQITQALERPLLKGLVRLGVRNYMSIYQEEASHSEALLQLAKLDFNLVQSLHKKELSEITRWWKELEFERKMPFARNRIVELYFWTTGVFFEPHYSTARKVMAKVIAMGTVMDDIYDAFGTFEELDIFTEAIRRWDVNFIDELPDYMQTFYHSLARLLRERCIPSMEEYMHVATASVGNSLLSTVCLVGMGGIVTDEVFQWLSNNPKILKASNTIFRLMDDIGGHKLQDIILNTLNNISTILKCLTIKTFDKERGHVASSIDCYMKQYGVSEQKTLDVFNKQVVDMVVDLVYKKGDGFTHVDKFMKDIIASLFINPVPL
ncbi:(-)-alpha-pinene synthase-like [Pyrus ussuriensis x Pyrus communis]|uniref:(-)-alpha-pinene synthase-like n=1 Tax=Pyrus ussuriensis x Pyrus communis TaxID=2448454 RepID=A0A5N5EWD4_9ROSA|nr:(-)-alpha-pinene synthase-like [Pyrus ussuriensis x Pyrus communis]